MYNELMFLLILLKWWYLITDINTDRKKQRVVRSMVEFSHSISTSLIAEK